jgi:hypothetical protein
MVYPNNNLPTASQPWGKAIQRDLEALQSKVTSNEVNNKARDEQLNAAQQRLAAQVTSISELAGQAVITANSAASAAADAQASLVLANEAITQIQYILGILQEPAPPTTSNSGSWSIGGPSGSFGSTQVLAVTVSNPGSYTNADISASVIFHATAEVTAQAASGAFYLTDGVTANSSTSWAMPTGSGSYPKTNSYSQSYTKSYTTGGSKTLYLYVNSSALPSEYATLDATINLSATWS